MDMSDMADTLDVCDGCGTPPLIGYTNHTWRCVACGKRPKPPPCGACDSPCTILDVNPLVWYCPTNCDAGEYEAAYLQKVEKHKDLLDELGMFATIVLSGVPGVYFSVKELWDAKGQLAVVPRLELYHDTQFTLWCGERHATAAEIKLWLRKFAPQDSQIVALRNRLVELDATSHAETDHRITIQPEHGRCIVSPAGTRFDSEPGFFWTINHHHDEIKQTTPPHCRHPC